ncbi:MAG: hypothetical protein ABI658_03635 [Acidimicrobiales bacterium]
MDDLDALGPYEVRFIQPYQATKRYICPSCNQHIEPGTGHYVVIPTRSTDLRRHWHRGCWERREHRRANPSAAKSMPKPAVRVKKPPR